MDFWKYNIGDEILFEGKAYRIANRIDEIDDRYIIHDKTYGLYCGVPREEIESHAKPIKEQKNAPNGSTDAVNHPSYYQGKIEVIDFIDDKNLGFNLGNCVKYISRAGKKNPEKFLEDLEKARWYLNREISRIKKESTETQWLPNVMNCNRKINKEGE